jgi:CRISPR-associated endonuclease/helicase Cas3
MKVTDFDDFFIAIHAVPPFPWQRRLVKTICDSDRWPRVIDLPTGAGKTACIDIALFQLLVAAAAGRAQAAARRIAFVVDRRIIVDEAASRARHIAEKISRAQTGVLREAGALLESISGASTIQVVTLRGGAPREVNLVRDPTAVAVVLSTVDQLGSRLLFRGYGVSDYATPMHAGMFGCDTLLLLDEAHIAEPFRQTLQGIEREQARAMTPSGATALRWTQLSATPSVIADFSIDDDDRQHPVLSARLKASKRLKLLEVAKRDELPKTILELLNAELASGSQSSEEQPRIGVVVNRVATARDIFAAISAALKDQIELHLLIGRVRPLDRDRFLAHVTPALKSSVHPRQGERPIVVVATQTIEVGADFDFHTMFIESASYAAVRQRVGRLNRLGVRGSARGAIVLVRADADDDPVYGKAILATWATLQGAARDGTVDLGISDAPAGGRDTEPLPPATPELSASLLGLLIQTSPRPAEEPEVSHFLHGFGEQTADVSVVWRRGVSAKDGEVDETRASLVLDVLPPLTAEVMSLPLSSLRSWLQARMATRPQKQIDAGDLEGDTREEDVDRDKDLNVLLVADDLTKVRLSEVRPGSVVVVPCEWGGTDRYGFAPSSSDMVEDFALAARLGGQHAPTLVVTEDVVAGWFSRATSADVAKVLSEELFEQLRPLDADPTDELADAGTICLDWIERNREGLLASVVDTALHLRERFIVVEAFPAPGSGSSSIVLRARRPMPGDLSDDDVGLQRTVEVTLDEHCRGVAEFAARFAARLALPDALQVDLRLAGRLHDLGKADPRFQAMLGSDGTRLLAKGTAFERRIRLGARHECYSVALIDRYPMLLADANDPDLVRYLVGTHHGRGRGLQAPVEDRGVEFHIDFDGSALTFRGNTNLADAGSGWPSLFSSMNRRYGAWGIAYLETILRLADHRRSEAELQEAL